MGFLGFGPSVRPRVRGTGARALGGDTASVAADADALQGVIHSTPLQQYDIHDITSANGVRLREFQNRNGVVFAVVWSGPRCPDLQNLGRELSNVRDGGSGRECFRAEAPRCVSPRPTLWSSLKATCAPIRDARICPP